MTRPFVFRINAAELFAEVQALHPKQRSRWIEKFSQDLLTLKPQLSYSEKVISEALELIEKKRIAGAMGGRPKKPEVKQRLSTAKANGKLEVEVELEEEIIKEKKRKEKFTPPQPAEVGEYMQEIGYTTGDGERFVDYYETRGWQINGHPMKNWKAAVRTWFRKWKEANEHISTTNTLGIF